MVAIQVDNNGKAIILNNNKALLAQEFIGVPRKVVNGVYKAPDTSFTFSLPNDVTTIGEYALQSAFRLSQITSADLSSVVEVGDYGLYTAFQDTPITSLDLSSLETIGTNSLYYMCRQSSGRNLLTSINLSNLTTINGTNAMSGAFFNNTGLTSIDLSGLTTVSGSSAFNNTFAGCTNIASFDFSNLTTIGKNTSTANYSQFNSAFNNCNLATTLSFPKLEKIYCTGGTTLTYGTFASNNRVKKMYFPKLDTITYGSGATTANQNACKNIFYGCTALTELHFAAANQSAIEATAGYSTAWGLGAGNVTIYFDL